MKNLLKSKFSTAKSKAIGFLFVILAFAWLASTTNALDLLEQTFQQSKQYDTVVDIGNTKNAVGNDLIRGGTTINVWGWPVLQQQDPLLVRIIKWMLRIMAIIGVSMWIIVGIQYIMAQWDSAKEKKAIGNLVKIVIGIIIALSAIAIVNLVQSITRSSINL